MTERKITIQNDAGIHCRPSGVIISTANKEFPQHKFSIECNGKTTDLNSILALISLGLTKGTRAVLRVSGPDEENAAKRIGDLFEFHFDFPR